MTVEEAKTLIGSADYASPIPHSWADLGCGSGLFSRALAELLPIDSHILCLDKDRQNWDSLNVQRVHLEFRQVNFLQETIPGSGLDGILMANSLHYVSDKRKFIQKLRANLCAKGQFLIVEYDTERSNPWVPYPISFPKLQELFSSLGFTKIKKIGERRSSYGPNLMYAAEIKF